MKAILRRMDGNSTRSWEDLVEINAKYYGLWLTVAVGPENGIGADYFQIFVCNRDWLNSPEGIVYRQKKHFLMEGGFNPTAIRGALETYFSGCIGDSWEELVEQISKIGEWEFEGYH